MREFVRVMKIEICINVRKIINSLQCNANNRSSTGIDGRGAATLDTEMSAVGKKDIKQGIWQSNTSHILSLFFRPVIHIPIKYECTLTPSCIKYPIIHNSIHLSKKKRIYIK